MFCRKEKKNKCKANMSVNVKSGERFCVVLFSGLGQFKLFLFIFTIETHAQGNWNMFSMLSFQLKDAAFTLSKCTGLFSHFFFYP